MMRLATSSKHYHPGRESGGGRRRGLSRGAQVLSTGDGLCAVWGQGLPGPQVLDLCAEVSGLFAVLADLALVVLDLLALPLQFVHQVVLDDGQRGRRVVRQRLHHCGIKVYTRARRTHTHTHMQTHTHTRTRSRSRHGLHLNKLPELSCTRKAKLESLFPVC